MPESKSSKPISTCRVELDSQVLTEIRQHARSAMAEEICGVLIGEAADGVTKVSARIPGEGAAQAGAQVTFTQEAWEHIYRVKDELYPDLAVVGWYHSHPGFGIFFSDYDEFIHANFFNAPHQIGWVCDPHSGDEGCFGWVEGEVRLLGQVSVKRSGGDCRVEEQAVAARQRPKVAAWHWVGQAWKVLEILLIVLLAFFLGVLARPLVDHLGVLPSWLRQPHHAPVQIGGILGHE